MINHENILSNSLFGEETMNNIEMYIEYMDQDLSDLVPAFPKHFLKKEPPLLAGDIFICAWSSIFL